MPNGNRLRWWLSILIGLSLLFTISVVRAEEDPVNIIAYQKPLDILRYRTVLEITGTTHLPSDVDVDGKGNIYILDGTANVVRIYDAKGHPLYTLGGQGVLKKPLGLDVTPDGDVVVADSGNHRLAIFPAIEKSPRYIPVPAPVGGKPADPSDVIFAGNRHTFVTVDNDNHRLVCLGDDGKKLWITGTMGRNPEEFRFPFLMDRGKDGRIYVVEVINTRVQVLEPTGVYSRFISEWGIEPGQVFRPKGVAVNEKNEVFISDSYVGVIQKFDHLGRFLGAVGDINGSLWKFTTPMGMTAVGNRLYVVEMFPNRILVLERIGK